MSLFGSFMGDFEDDPFFGAHMRQMRQMNAMMNQMFAGNPFGSLMGGGMMGGGMAPPALAAPMNHPLAHHRGGQEIMPFGGFPPMNMNRMFQGLGDMSGGPECHSYSSSTVMTMSSGPDGRPQVYQASASTRTAPGGVKEVKKSVCDSRSGVKKLAIGHHIGERAHVLEREQNLHSGDQEERHEFINLEEEEADEFNHEFEQKARYTHGGNAVGYSPRHHSGGSSGRRPREAHLALPPAYSSSRVRSRDSIARRTQPALTSSTSYSDDPRDPEPAHQASSQSQVSRKRDHEPDVERKHKSLKPSPHRSSPPM